MSEERQRIAAPQKQAAASQGVLQRKCACSGTPGPTGECAQCRRKRTLREQQQHAVQRKAVAGTPRSVPPVSIPSGGAPMQEEVRQLMERRFHTSFADVRVHTSSSAGRAAVDLGARAFTRGTDVYFAPDQYQPRSQEGLQLLAHELTHVLQQRTGRYRPEGQAHHGAATQAQLETEAERVGQSFHSSPDQLEVHTQARSKDIHRVELPSLSELIDVARRGLIALADWVMTQLGDAASSLLRKINDFRKKVAGLSVVRVPAGVAAEFEQIYAQLKEAAPFWLPVPSLRFDGSQTQQDAGVVSIPVAVILLFLALVIFLYWYFVIWLPAVGRGEPQRAIQQAIERVGELIDSIPLPFAETPLKVKPKEKDKTKDKPKDETEPKPEPKKKPDKTTDPVPPEPPRRRGNLYPLCWPLLLPPPTTVLFTRLKSPDRDYTGDNQKALKAKRQREEGEPDFHSKDYHIHHVVPLFLGGEDKLQSPSKGGNGLIWPARTHLRGHDWLRHQPQMATPPPPLLPFDTDIYKHPVGTPYCLAGFKASKEEVCAKSCLP